MSSVPAFFIRSLTLTAALALVACGSQTPEPAPAAPPAAAPVATPTPEPAPAPADETASADQDDSGAQDSSTPDTDAGSESDAATPATTPDADATAASAPDAAPPATAPAAPEGPEPRLGTDYQIIDPPQLLAAVPGKVEIAEVFSYTCIHCARLETLTPAWKKTLPAEVNFVYAPMSHGAFEPIARGFYAAQAMGVLEQTHSGMFKALAEQQKIGRGRIEDIAALYGELGVDAEALKATAGSFAVNTQISRSQRTLARWAIEGTPTIVVAGKYRVVTTGDRGHEGMLQSARWLAQREIAEQAGAAR